MLRGIARGVVLAALAALAGACGSSTTTTAPTVVTITETYTGTLIPASPGLSALMRDVPIGSIDAAPTIRRLDMLVRHRRPLASG